VVRDQDVGHLRATNVHSKVWSGRCEDVYGGSLAGRVVWVSDLLLAFEIGKTFPNCVEAIDSKHTIALVIILSLGLRTWQ